MFLIAVRVYSLNEVLVPVVPYTDTTYTKPVETSSVLLILKLEVFGAIRNIDASLRFFEYSRYSLDSSTVISGRTKPSTPASFAFSINFLKPLFCRILEYVITTIGSSGYFFLVVLTISRQISGLKPFFSALNEASGIVGPSAIGSEKGIPISIMSAPPSATDE